MKRKFVLNLALLLFLNLLVKPFWIFGIDRTVQNMVGVESYGFYFSLFNFSMILNILLDLGITNYNNRNIARHHFLLDKHVSNIVGLKITLGFFYAIVSLSIAAVLKYEWEQFKLLFVLIFNQFLLSFILYLRSNISGLHKFRTDSFISVLDRLLLIIICSGLIWGHFTDQPFQIEWFVYAQTGSYSITAAITFLIVLAHCKKIKLKFNISFFRMVLKKSFPFALLTLLMAFYSRSDAVLIERLLPNGKEQAGIYAQSFRIIDALSMFSFLFAALLLPIFSKMIKKKEPVIQLVKLSFFLLIVPVTIIVSNCYFYRSEIIDLLYKSHVSFSAQIFGVLIISFVAISFSYIFGTLLTANGSLRLLNQTATAGIIINIILNLILIPRYQALGAAYTALITQSGMAIIQLFIARKIFRFHINWKLISVSLFFILGIISISYLTIQINGYWVLKFFGAILLSFSLGFFLKLINLKDIFEIIRMEKTEN